MSENRVFLPHIWVNGINDVNTEVTLTMVPGTCVHGVFKELIFVYSRFMQTTSNKTTATLPLKLISLFNNFFFWKQEKAKYVPWNTTDACQVPFFYPLCYMSFIGL